MNNSKVEYKPKLPRVKKTYAFHADVAELIETHKYENCGRELDYVSCSPFRVPIARLAAAQAAIKG